MSVSMQITKEWLKEKSPCTAGYGWFLERFPEGGEYQAVLDELAKENLADWANWLIHTAGPADTVLDIESLSTKGSVFFCWKNSRQRKDKRCKVAACRREHQSRREH